METFDVCLESSVFGVGEEKKKSEPDVHTLTLNERKQIQDSNVIFLALSAALENERDRGRCVISKQLSQYQEELSESKLSMAVEIQLKSYN